MQTRERRLRCRTTKWPAGTLATERWEGRTRSEAERLADAWGAFLGRVPWVWFATLTFDPKRVYPVSRELASRETFKWCGDLGYLYRKPIAWVYGVERSPGGLWHTHVLIVGAGAPEWLPAVHSWRVRNGRVDLQAVADVDRVALYTSKALAYEGEVVWSDTLLRYKGKLASTETALLY